ncbi:MAG: hypothetical protein HYS41_05905 [Candidatus Omnitrophica bacterium]|nr:hypothetical protein [Candidatus Omnitrophota bacterium]
MRRTLRTASGVFIAGALALAAGLPLAKARLEHSISGLLSASVKIQGISLWADGLTLHRVSLRPNGPGAPAAAGALLNVQRLTLGQFWKLGRGSSITVKGGTFSLAGVPVQAKGEVDLELPNGRCEGWMKIQHPLWEGWLEVSGRIKRPVLLGWFQGKGLPRRHFVAELDWNQERLLLSQAEIQGGWRLTGFLERKASPDIRGRLDLTGSSGRGRMSCGFLLHPPDGSHLTLQLKGLRAEEILPWFLPPERLPNFSGWLEGQASLEGPWQRLVSRGRLTGREVTLGSQTLPQVSFEWEGLGPRLTIINSHMNKPSGVVWMDGTVDLRKIGRPDFFSMVRLSSLEKGWLVSGWQMDPVLQGSGLEVRRVGPEDQTTVSLAYGVDGQVQPEPLVQSKVQADIPLTSSERLNIRLEGQEEFLGVEHRGKF